MKTVWTRVLSETDEEVNGLLQWYEPNLHLAYKTAVGKYTNHFFVKCLNSL